MNTATIFLMVSFAKHLNNKSYGTGPEVVNKRLNYTDWTKNNDHTYNEN